MPDRQKDAYAKGLAGEQCASEYLQKRGMVLLQRRYHSPYGEIDLIMQEGDTLVFVEVKTRTRGAKGDGLMAIHRGKQKRLIQTAMWYMGQHRVDSVMRFDAVEWTAEGIVHIPNAFEAFEI